MTNDERQHLVAHELQLHMRGVVSALTRAEKIGLIPKSDADAMRALMQGELDKHSDAFAAALASAAKPAGKAEV
jgi:predicted nucleic acid-binding protein